MSENGVEMDGWEKFTDGWKSVAQVGLQELRGASGL